jgi:hypothetical protein
MQTVNRVVNWPCTLRRILHIMVLSESAKSKKCGQEKASSLLVLCQCSALVRLVVRLEIFGSAWLKSINIRRASVRLALALTVRPGPFEGL